MKVLVIDDDLQIRRSLSSILTTKGYEVILAETGEKGIHLARESDPSLVILDLSLPGIGGLDVCKALRTSSTVPILVLSVHEHPADKITALDLGADDYLTKPFTPGELLARMRALLRRMGNTKVTVEVVEVGELYIDFVRRRVTLQGYLLSLTPIEYKILSLLAQNVNCVVTNHMLAIHIWGTDFAENMQTLRMHISNLRKKIEINPLEPHYLITEFGVGFRLVSE